MLCYVMCQRRGDCRTRPARQVLFAGRAADSTTEGRIDTTAPFITELFNRSLSSGRVPEMFKAAYVTPRIKKADMDPTDPRLLYRPISNLPVSSKLPERLVARQLLAYLNTSGLLPRLQSAYRPHHSTETAILKVLSDILLARPIDAGDLSALVLLD